MIKVAVPKIQNAHNPETRNIINKAIDVLNSQGKFIQDLVAKGQLTPKQYADLITLVNDMVSSDEAFLKENGININDLDEPTRQTFLEAQGIDVNYVLGEGNVNVKNTTFVEEIMIGSTDQNINNKFTLPGRISHTAGVYVADDIFRATGFISTEDATYFFRYVLDGSNNGVFADHTVAFYSSASESGFISGETAGTNYTVTQHEGKYGRKYNIPSGAKYVRFSLPVGNAQGGSGNLYTYLKIVGNNKRRFVNDYNSYLLENMDIGKGSSHLSDKTIAFFGDSILGNFRDGTGVPDIFKEETGATVHNLAFGGSTMGIRTSTNSQAKYWDEFSMTRIADYISSGNFSPMETALPNMSSALSYFPDVVNQLKSINWNTVDIIFIQHGTNDFTQSLIAKDEQNLTNRQTYYGAYNYALDKILTKYPHLKVVLLTPTWRYWDNAGVYTEGSDTYIINGQTLTALVDVVYDMQKNYHVPVINNYLNSNWNKYTRNIYLQDGTHPNEVGRRSLGERVAHQAISIL